MFLLSEVPMPGKNKTKFAQKNQKKDIQKRQARSLDQLAEFDKFTKVIAPKLKKAVLENWSPEKMRKEFAPFMQAKMIQKGIEGNFNAIKDTLDRYEGTAVQRIEQKTLYAKMTKKERAALALQKLKDARLLTFDSSGKPIINAEFAKVAEDDE
jgi:hypothetical protein